MASKRARAADGALLAALRRIALPDPGLEIRLARLDLEPGQVRLCASLLSPDERQRAERFHFARDRRRFIVARGMLRLLLGTYLDTAPAAIAFGYGRSGKPFVARRAAPVHFSVSHSDERALYGISRTCPLGIDIECLDRDVDYCSLARRFFSHREHAELLRIPEPDRKRAFLACWTRKEAVAKATGDGLSLPFDQFGVTVALDTAPRVVDFAITTLRASDWDLYAVNAGRGYVATVAAYRRK